MKKWEGDNDMSGIKERKKWEGDNDMSGIKEEEMGRR
jgi:hypothetical protein